MNGMLIKSLRVIARHWLSRLWSRDTIYSASATVGAIWTIIEIINLFYSANSRWIKEHPVIFWTAVVIATIIQRRPPLSAIYKIEGTDIKIEIRIGDPFTAKGTLIVECNTAFDTNVSNGIVDKSCLLARFISTCYSNTDALDHSIEAALRGIAPCSETTTTCGKNIGYSIGTVARINASSRCVYLVASHETNIYKVSSSSFESVRQCLPRIWLHAKERGNMEALVISVLGANINGVRATRNEIVQEIIRSFITAASEDRFTDKLVISVSPLDFESHDLDLGVLGDFLRLQCCFRSSHKDAQEELAPNGDVGLAG